jgi:hypothetical protein
MLVVAAVPALVSRRQTTTLPLSQPAFSSGLSLNSCIVEPREAQHKVKCIVLDVLTTPLLAPRIAYEKVNSEKFGAERGAGTSPLAPVQYL